MIRTARWRIGLLSACLLVQGMSLLSAAEKADSHTFMAEGVKLHYLTAGAGQPVILLHGLTSSAEMNWLWPGVIADLARDYRVIALDLPGHGKSDKPAAAEAYGQQVVTDVVLLMDHLKIRRAHIVGYSMGGMVAMRLLVDHPDRVLTGTLGGMGWLKAGSPLQKFWSVAGGRDGRKPPQGFLSGITDFAVTEKDLKAIEVPVNIIIGDRDPCRQMYVIPLQQVRDDWPVTELRDAGHFGAITRPEFRKAIHHWLDDHRP